MRILISALSKPLQKRIKEEAFKFDKRSERAIPEEEKLSVTYPILAKEVEYKLGRVSSELNKNYLDESLAINWAKKKTLEKINSLLLEISKLTK